MNIYVEETIVPYLPCGVNRQMKGTLWTKNPSEIKNLKVTHLIENNVFGKVTWSEVDGGRVSKEGRVPSSVHKLLNILIEVSYVEEVSF